MTMVDVTITVDRDRSTDEAIVSAVEKEGFVVERVFPELRAIYGHGPMELMEKVASISGVANVRFSNNYQLPPMNPRIPQ